MGTFRIASPPPVIPPRPKELLDEEDEYILMDDDFVEGEPTHARSAVAGRVTGPGEVIADAEQWMRGHGTYLREEKVLASVAGTLERVNKLISVRALRTKYRPEVGDLVVGRIVEVGPRRWKVEAYAAQHAVLMLSSINLPGGVQRRKVEADELQMRSFFQEGDLLVAEVQAFFSDGAMSLHTRSLKYGKLKNGMLVMVPPSLIVRSKSHFHSLPFGVDLIIGLNGYIWVSKTVAKPIRVDGEDEGFAEESGEGVYSGLNEDIPPTTRLGISRVALLLALLARHHIPISADIVVEAHRVSVGLVSDDAAGVRSLTDAKVGQEILRELAAAGE